MSFYTYDFESNITRLEIEERDPGELYVVIAIKPRASQFVERRIFTTEHIHQLLLKRGYKIEQVLFSSNGIRNYSKDENKNSGVWIFKLMHEDKPTVTKCAVKQNKRVGTKQEETGELDE